MRSELSKRWSFVMGTINNISDFLQPLEDCSRSKFIPVITNTYECNDLERAIYSLPTKHAVRGYRGTPGSKDNENSDISTVPYSKQYY